MTVVAKRKLHIDYWLPLKFIIVLVLSAVGPISKYEASDFSLKLLNDQFYSAAQQARILITKQLSDESQDDPSIKPMVDQIMRSRYSSIPGFCTSGASEQSKKAICDKYSDLNEAEFSGVVVMWLSALVPVLLGLVTMVQLYRLAKHMPRENWLIEVTVKSVNKILGLGSAALVFSLALLGPGLIIALIFVLILYLLQRVAIKMYTKGLSAVEIEKPDWNEVVSEYVENS